MLLIKSETLPEVVIRRVIQYISDSTLYKKNTKRNRSCLSCLLRQQLDESTDVANVAQNFIFNTYAHNDVKELSYFCEPPESKTTGRYSKKKMSYLLECYCFCIPKVMRNCVSIEMPVVRPMDDR